MKSAKEMFEKQGYKQLDIDSRSIFPLEEGIIHYEGLHYSEEVIDFDTKKKMIRVCYRDLTDVWGKHFFDLPTIKSIVKQCEELGWLK